MCSGKSSTAEYLTTKYDLGLYKIDGEHNKHLAHLSRRDEPYLYSIRSRRWSQAFLRSPKWMLNDLLKIYRDEIGMTIQDLIKLPRDRITIAEGAVFTPQLIYTFAKPSQVVYLIATKNFQLQHGQTRGEWVKKILTQYSDPEAAYERWMKRDAMFSRYVKEGAKRYGYDVLDITGRLDLQAIEKKVEKRLNEFKAKQKQF